MTDPQPATAELAWRLVQGVGDVWWAAQPHAHAATTAAAAATSLSSAAVGAATSTGTGAAVDAGEGSAAGGAAALDAGEANEDVAAPRVAACCLPPPYSGRPRKGCR